MPGSRRRAGQVFVGEDLVHSVSPKGFQVFEVGEFKLKAIARPVKLFEAVPNHAE